MRIRVELQIDHEGRLLPHAIHFDRRRLVVAEMLDQWYGPDYRYIKVRGHDDGTYILKFHETCADWELTMFERANSRARGMISHVMARPGRTRQ